MRGWLILLVLILFGYAWSDLQKIENPPPISILWQPKLIIPAILTLTTTIILIKTLKMRKKRRKGLNTSDIR